ncbi:aldo/keto reductase [Paracoccus caeni]|uniref:Aldo/keto reductase n=1 Tax=Paracoccus caeni TaxID=657651 RepID=A0A934SA66_9RHOB|nr:aldo/keto reductase [Paracoccus caeni]MBK4215016.1 aldo/keto reductase [Paracoccus caeni]
MQQPTLMLNDGRRIPQLGLGVWQMPEDEVQDAVASALNIGYRLIDGAAIYRNEAGMGRGVREAAVARDEVFVTSKLWNADQGRDSTLRAFDTTMERLKLEYLDLYLMHWPTPARGLYVETWKAMIELRASGRVRSIGVSNYHEAHLRKLIDETGVTPAVNQIELHPSLNQSHMREVDRDLGIITQSWSPLGQATALASGPVQQIADRLGASPAQVVIAWHMAHGLSVIPKSVNPDRQRENFEALTLRLTDEDIATIDALDRPDGRIGPNPDDYETT